MSLAVAVPTLADLPALYRICLLTGDAGQDATARHDDPDLLGHVYAGAYLTADPGLCRVLLDGSRVVGYCLGTADTRAFEAWCESEWYPGLRSRYPRPRDDDHSPDARLVRQLHVPERVADEVVEAYPAHLHIDLLPQAQGTGGGRRLIQAVHTALAERGAAGVHLGVAPTNTRAIGFYEHLGYRRQPTPDGVLMARPLP